MLAKVPLALLVVIEVALLLAGFDLLSPDDCRDGDQHAREDDAEGQRIDHMVQQKTQRNGRRADKRQHAGVLPVHGSSPRVCDRAAGGTDQLRNDCGPDGRFDVEPQRDREYRDEEKAAADPCADGHCRYAESNGKRRPVLGEIGARHAANIPAVGFEAIHFCPSRAWAARGVPDDLRGPYAHW